MNRRPASSLILAVSLCGGLDACGSKDGSTPIGEVGTYPEGGIFAAGDAGRQEPLDAYIEQGTTQVKIVTLSCSGPCADVQVVATNGNPPYTFRWEDGTASAFRHVCPTANTQYQVTVTDTGMTGEIAHAAETVKVPLAADVIACPAAGDAGSDASAPPGMNCVTYTNADMQEPACPDPIGGQSLFRIPLPSLMGGSKYTVEISADLTANGGLTSTIETYRSAGNCDRSQSNGMDISSNSGSSMWGYGVCFAGDDAQAKDLLVDFMPGFGGTGYTLGNWSAQICTAPTCF